MWIKYSSVVRKYFLLKFIVYFNKFSPLICALIAEVEEYCRQKQGPYMEDKVSSTCKVELADTRESTVSGHSMKDKVITTKMCVKFWKITNF